MKIVPSNFFDKLKGKKKLEAVIICLVGVLIVCLLFFNGKSTKKQAETETFPTDEYVTTLENKLAKTLSEIQGAGKVEVMITISSGMQTIHETETTINVTGQTTTTVKKPVVVNGKPIVVAEKNPEIVGVIIVSSGAGQLSVKMQLSLAAATVLGISEKNVQIFTSN